MIAHECFVFAHFYLQRRLINHFFFIFLFFVIFYAYLFGFGAAQRNIIITPHCTNISFEFCRCLHRKWLNELVIVLFYRKLQRHNLNQTDHFMWQCICQRMFSVVSGNISASNRARKPKREIQGKHTNASQRLTLDACDGVCRVHENFIVFVLYLWHLRTTGNVSFIFFAVWFVVK